MLTAKSAQSICDQALEIFGAQVEAQTILCRQGEAGYHALIYHKRLQRQILLAQVRHWQEIRDAWLAVTVDEPGNSC